MSSGQTNTPTVTVNNCTGTGSLGITINANTAHDAASNQNLGSSASATATVTNLVCPSGGVSGTYIPVLGNTSYGTSDFCVMKYEAKVKRDSDQVIHTWGCDTDLVSNTGDGLCTGVASNWVLTVPQPSTPVSTPEGRPWREIDRDQALAECRSLNSEFPSSANIDADVNQDGTYDLISNDEWQTLARNIELVPSNWSENVVGGVSTGNGGTNSNAINHGHGDLTPDEPLVADPDGSKACIGTGQEVNPGVDDSCTGGWNIEKRTHTLSNGEVIWDLAGNVWEWVKDDNTNNYGATTYISQITSASHPTLYSLSGGTTTTARMAKDQFCPINNYTSLSAGTRGGLGNGYLAFSAGAVHRGGFWSNASNAGIFAVTLVAASTYAFRGIGFRCVYRPKTS